MLRLYDPRTRRVEEMRPARPGVLRMFTCGPHVNGATHIGELRASLVADLIRRAAERHGLRVISVQTVLDADSRGAGDATADPAAGERAFQYDLGALNIHPAIHQPRASECLDLIRDLIAQLLDSGHAYNTPDGSVFFDTTSSGDSSLTDWALWTADDQGYPSAKENAWSAGFPGRHLACSATTLHYLGGLVDVHTGDTDRGDPGHERERAQSNAVTGREVVRHWVHVQPPTAEGPETDTGATAPLLSTLEDHGLDPLALRLALLDHGYHERPTLTWKGLRAADQTLARWRGNVAEWAESPSAPMCAGYVERVHGAFDDDLDTPTALRILQELRQDDDIPAGSKFEAFAQLDRIFGLDLARDIGKR